MKLETASETVGTETTLETSSHGEIYDVDHSMLSLETSAESQSMPTRISFSKRVRIDERRNQYHEGRSGLVLTPRERYNSWYFEEDIRQFRIDAARCAELLFAKRDGSLLRRWKMDKKDQRIIRSSVFCKKTLSAAYKECNRIKTEEDFGPQHCTSSTVDRASLVKAYETVDDDVCLTGLEGIILLTLRSEAYCQIRYILDAVEQRMGGVPAMNANPDHRDQMMRMFSQYISLPSRVFVHELALAQAEIVQKDARAERR
mmetsp:Transcript_1999/g.4855  ORF Transcript_1999/g.4855 Transcript_1999/m.4855 type:complete len:259 (-) Transcript_1999:218-994(-)